jgi:flagellar biosynthesis protein FliQ
MLPLYLRILHQALTTEVMVIGPIVITILVVGFITGFFQAALQIEDATFNLLPKTIAMIILVLLGAFGAMPIFEHFTTQLILNAPSLVRQPWN